MKTIINFFRKIFMFFDKILITPIMKLVLKIKNIFTGNGKSFEKMITSKKALLIISLLIAFLAFYVFDRNSSLMINNHAERLYAIPVKAVYNEEAYVVEGLPETADVILFGNSSYITLAKQYPNPTISVDLRELSVGTHKVAFAVVEAKRSITSYQQLQDALSQVRSYAKLLSTKFAVIISQEKVWIFSESDDYEKTVLEICATSMTDDHIYVMRKIIGR